MKTVLTETKLGRYKVIKKIGAGGMGEVFLAHDEQLDRNVALKVLLPEFSSDAERVRRFKLEAKAASALNHPNIITIFEIVEADGRLFIVYEYIEGKTLREKISRNQLNISDSIKIIEQVANALAVAHKAGIVHRDIKPENIMIRDDGYVKILDFGLAKKRIFESDNEAETIQQIKTHEGLIMGSVFYMSPEQARGKETDNRSDIWSLGVVLYEMLAGKSPFEDETISDSIAAILYSEIEPIKDLFVDIPLKLQQIIEKSLKKDLVERYQSIEDFIKDLRILREDLKDDVSTLIFKNTLSNEKTIELKKRTTDQNPTLIEEIGTRQIFNTTQESQWKTNSPPIEKTKKRKWLLIPAICLTALTTFSLYNFFHPNLFPNYYNRFADKEVTALTDDGKSHSAAISPDGKFIAFARESEKKQSLILKEIETGNEKEIVPPAKVEFLQPTFSPDGTEIYFVSKENGVGTLYNISLEWLKNYPERENGSRKLIVDIDSKITFLPGGYSFAFIRHDENENTDTIFVTDTYFGIIPQPTKKLASSETEFKKINEVSWQSAKDIFTVTGILKGGGLAQNLSFGSIAVKTYGKSSFLESSVRFYNFGHYDIKNYVFLKDGTYFYLERPQISDTSQIRYSVPAFYKGIENITNDLNNYSSFDVSADGNTIVATKTDRFSSIWSYVPQTNEFRQLTSDSKTLWAEDGISQMSDGKILYSKKTGKELYTIMNYEDGRKAKIRASNEIQIFVADEDGSNEKQLTSESEYNLSPIATPDGKYILFISNRKGSYSIWRMDVDGNNPFKLAEEISIESGIQTTPDSKTVIYTKNGNQMNLMKTSIDGGETVALIPDSQSSNLYPRISPNGKYLAYLSVQYDKATSDYKELLNIVNFNEGKAGDLLLEEKFDFASSLQWSPDSKSLCFIKKQETENLWSFSINDKREKPLTQFDSGGVTNFAWSQDEKKILIVRSNLKNDLVLIKSLDKISH